MAENDKTTFLEDKMNDTACKLCHKDVGRYTCPRCKLLYCSSVCYKSEAHAACSEEFYKQCFMQGLHELNSAPEEKQKMLDMLSRLENGDNDNTIEEEDEEAEEEADLAERLHGINLDEDPDGIWRCLTDKERVEFEKMVSDGRLANMLQLWKPWWTPSMKPVHDLEKVARNVPKILTTITDMNKLLPKSKPADRVMFTVINVIYGYCYVTRLHNGDYMSTPEQSVQELLDISEGLENKNYVGVAEAIHACQHCIQKQGSSLFVSNEYMSAVLRDVKQILEGLHHTADSSTPYTLHLLSDLHQLLQSAITHLNKDVKQHDKESHKGKELRDQRRVYHCAKKKCEFLLSWLQRYNILLQEAIPEIDMLTCEQLSSLSKHNKDKEAVETILSAEKKVKKPLIQEVT